MNVAGYVYWIVKTESAAAPDAAEVLDIVTLDRRRRLTAYSAGAANDEGLTEWETAMLLGL